MENYIKYITINPEIRFGKPCIINTRIAISDILKLLASNVSYNEILNDYPQLKHEHILAALSYAANKEEMTKIISKNYESAA